MSAPRSVPPTPITPISPRPSIGRIVHYTLSDGDAQAINKRHRDGQTHMAEHQARTDGSIVHIGNPVAQGDIYPMIITRVWNEDPGTVNGQVLLDGNDAYWATSRTPGDGPGDYAWPTRD